MKTSFRRTMPPLLNLHDGNNKQSAIMISVIQISYEFL